MPPRLTPLRREILQTLARLTREQGRPPSAAELAAACGVTPATMSFHLNYLLGHAYVSRPTPRGALQLTPKALQLVQVGIPVFGEIAAGPPSLAEQSPEHVTPSLDALLGVQEDDFMLRVRGSSMVGIGVMDGDYVVVRPTPEVMDGEVAVVLLPSENAATLKRIYHFGDEVTLIAENPDFPRLTLPAADVQIQGRMIGKVGLGVPRSSYAAGSKSG